ncbi:unnamed protein product [Gongylonema pulchrum]|uniref:Uncharacterized protein n=1 Tax=Gongylonema pulchrum TaxID=637853 RepID=A0A183DXQ0_9BILA|nr:unnamed protein product [Gongylonema pulchrum]
MPMRSGARGLNLTVANNIIFVEPQMDVSCIAQVCFALLPLFVRQKAVPLRPLRNRIWSL